MSREHPLFLAHPFCQNVTVSTGDLPVPYHVYAGHGALIGGLCDPVALARAFAGQDVFPVLDEHGQGLAVLFVCDFTDASHGPHREIHLTALAAPTKGETLPADPAALFAAFALRPDWGVLSLHLWNDDPGVVAYNREFLGLDAQLCSGDFALTPNRVTFDFADADGAPLLRGGLTAGRLSEAGMMWGLLRHMGLSGVVAAARQPHATAHVINRKGPVIGKNLRARTLTAPDRMVVRRFRAGRDRLDLPHPVLEPYAFRATCLEHISPFRFVYLPPR